jgi:hypothetical protein
VEFILNEGLYRIRGELAGYQPQSFEVLISAGGVVERQPAFKKE